jgi:sigma-B regulation protein RsbU (phosphoserine phosphatase)
MNKPRNPVSSFIRRHRLLRALMPGIRIKLACMTGLFVALILFGSTVFNYRNQTQLLEESFMKETASSLRYINSVVTGMENTRTNILLLEEMRLRIAEKRNDLRKYRAVVYRKKESIGNSFRSLGKKLGLNVRFEYTPIRVDSYYSIYLSDRELRAVEKEIMAGLHLKEGTVITEKSFRGIQTDARAVALAQNVVDDLYEMIARDNEALSAIPANGKDALRTTKLKTELSVLTRKITAAKKRLIAADIRLRAKLRPYFEYSLDRLEEIGARSDNIRIVTFDRNGNTVYDTAGRDREKILRFAPLENNPAFTQDRKNFFSAAETDPETIDRFSNEYRNTGGAYHVRYAPSYRNQDTFERAGAAIDTFGARKSEWQSYLYEDIRISKSIAVIAGGLRTRLLELREKKIPPENDSSYRDLYRKYRNIVAERDKTFERLNPYRNESSVIRARYDLLIENNSRAIQEHSARIAALEKNGESGEDRDEIRAEIETLRDQISALQKDTALLKIDRAKGGEEIDLSEKLTAAEAVRTLRNAALFDFITLRQKADLSSYRDYLRSSQTRTLSRRRWNTVREWIYAGGSETVIPERMRGTGGVKTITNGILSRSRSEAEEFMWKLDATPLVPEQGLFGIGSAYDALPGYLLEQSVTGYNAVLVDKTREEKKIEERGKTMLIWSGIIAVLAIVLTYFLSGFAVRRIGMIIGNTTRVREGDLDVTFPEKGLDEIEELGISLNGMIGGLREKERLKGEIAAAGHIQKQLLPETIPPTLEGEYSVGTFYRAMRGVGGDYYDFIEIGKGKLLFCIGDVSSHGVGPAIVMAMVRSHLHGIVRNGETNLIKILLELNKQIFIETPSYMYVTFFLGVIDSHDHTIEYCSAGHIKPLLYHYKEDSIETLEGGGFPVGMDDDTIFSDSIKIRSAKLRPGDLFFQYTDGANEAMNEQREQFGNERIISTISKYARKKPDVMISQIAEGIQKFTGKDLNAPGGITELNDDIAMIAIKRLR